MYQGKTDLSPHEAQLKTKQGTTWSGYFLAKIYHFQSMHLSLGIQSDLLDHFKFLTQIFYLMDYVFCFSKKL